MITIATGARLHFGLLAHRPAGGPEFGGVGVMVDQPRFFLSARARAAGEDRIVASQTACARVRDVLARVRTTSPPERPVPAIAVRVSEEIPPHVGFGSGTQLALAVARAAAAIAGEGTLEAAELARRTGRGRRSAVGVHGFDHGGLLIDGGKVRPDALGALLGRCDFPAEWRWVLVTPRNRTGLFSDAEREAFRRLPPMPAATTDFLYRLALSELLPAARGADFARFSAALHEFGRIVGEFFAPLQGGTFAHPAARELVPKLRRRGVTGIAQTSWGPTLCILCAEQLQAEALARELEAESAGGSDVRIARPLNAGASVSEC